MTAWARVALAMAVLVVPGALLVLVAYFMARAVMRAYETASASTGGRPVDWRTVMSHVNVKDVLHSARTAL